MAYGDVLIQREVMGGYVWSAIPVRDVAQPGTRIAVYRHRGTECWWPSHPRSAHPPFDEVTQRGKPWEDFAGCLTITEPGWDYSVSVLWHDDWTLLCWYVDVIRPYERTRIGYDFADHHLDLVVEASGDIWMKDKDDLDAAVGRGELDIEAARRAHHRLSEVRRQARAGQGVFGEDWPLWRPEPSWGPLRLRGVIGEALARSPTPHDAMLDEVWAERPENMRSRS